MPTPTSADKLADPRPARRLAPASARRPGDGRRRSPRRPRVFGRAIVMPNLQPAGDDDGAGARLPRTHPRRAARRLALRAADDALPHRQHAPRGNRAREGVRLRARGQVLPGGRDDEFRCRRHRARARLPGARGDGERTASCCRCTAKSPIPTSTSSIASASSSSARSTRIVRDFPGLRDRARAHHDARRPPRSSPPRRRSVAATITPQHLLYSRNALFAGGVRPHLYCLPILKRERHRAGAASPRRPAATRNSSSAPIPRRTRAHTKENACGCAGCYSAPRRARALRRGVRGGRRARPARRLREPLRRRLLRTAAQRRHGDARARAVDRAGRVPVRRASRSCRCARARRWPGASSRSLMRSVRRRNLGAAVLSYASEASQTVAARATGGRKVRAPQSRMPGNARPQ